MANIVGPELLEDALQALVRAGGYQSEQEAVQHAIEVLLAANPHLRTRTAMSCAPGPGLSESPRPGTQHPVTTRMRQ